MKDARPPTDPATLTQRVVRSAAWTLPTSLLSRAVGLIGTLILARFLAPGEYGEVSAAWIMIQTATSVTTFGVGIYLVANRDVSRDETFHATCFFLLTGVLVIGLALALRGPLGQWTDAPNVGRFMPIFALSGLIERIAFIPERVMVRQLRFGWLSIARAAGEFTFTGVSIVLAAMGVGAMAIAWGNLARVVLRSVAIMAAVDRRDWLEFHRLRFATLYKIVSYGIYVSISSIATFGMRRWDNLLVSRYFGPAVMGAYNYAYNLADTPAVAVGEQISDVIAASFPYAEEDKRAGALVRACTMISLIMFPLAFGLGAVAPTVARTFFDQKWANVGTMLVYLSVLSAPRPIAQILQAYFYTCQRLRVVLILEWLSLAAIVVGISTIGRRGINWTCATVGAVFVLRSLAAMWVVHRQDGISMAAFLLPLIRPLAACVAMVAAILAVRPHLAGFRPSIQLAIEVSIGSAVYVAGALLIARSASQEFIGLIRSALSRRRRRGGGPPSDARNLQSRG